jgi:hypothetical protein
MERKAERRTRARARADTIATRNSKTLVSAAALIVGFIVGSLSRPNLRPRCVIAKLPRALKKAAFRVSY